MMTEWIMSVVGAVLCSTLGEVLLSEGETKKFVRGILALIIVIVMLAPIPKLLDKNFEFTIGEEIPDSAESETDNGAISDYTSRVFAEKYKGYELDIQNKLSNLGIKETVVKIYYIADGFFCSVQSVEVDISKAVYTLDADEAEIACKITDVVTGSLSVSAQSVKIKR